MINQKIRIGTRGSKMALIQAKLVRDTLKLAHPDLESEIIVIETSGDWKPEHGEKPLSETDGGKGLFAKEIELAILDEQVDIGVHSVKDMPSFLPEGLTMMHYLKRDGAEDALVSEKYSSFDDLPQGATIGSTSVRRKSFLLHIRPDLNVINIRGNVTTRIDKMQNGRVDALILSASGLERIQQKDSITQIFSVEEMLPACGQGTIGIEYREMETEMRELLSSIHDVDTGLVTSAERGALRALNGSCRTPIGACATLDGSDLSLTVSVLRHDGTKIWTERETQSIHNDQAADKLGFEIGLKLKDMIDPDILI